MPNNNDNKQSNKNYQDLMKEMQTEAPDEAAPACTSCEELKAKLAELEETLQEQKNAALRSHADMENLRKRVSDDINKAHKFALQRFAAELLPIADSLEQGLQVNANDNELAKNIHKGMELTLDLLLKTLEKFHITPVNPQAGDPFDPALHQAMSIQQQENAPSNTIVQVLQKGYLLHDRLLRPALVIVTK